MSLNAFLFQRPFDDKERPAFRSQTELAAAVAQCSPKRKRGGKKDAENIRTFINQVLRGTRRAPNALRNLIIEATRTQLLKREFPKDFVERVLGRLGAEFEIGVVPANRPRDDPIEFASLDAEAERAKVHYILTIVPAEIKANTKAEILKADLVERLGLVPPWHHMRNHHIRYVFNLPDDDTAKLLFRHLHQYLIKAWSSSDPAGSLREAIDKRKCLVVRIVPAEFCIPPVVVFDPDADTPRGFVLEYQGESAVSVARLSKDTLTWWWRYVYLALGTTGTTQRVREMTYDDFATP